METRRSVRIMLLGLAAGAIVFIGAGQERSAPSAPQSDASSKQALAAPGADDHLHNVLKVMDKLISGALPENDAHFDELKFMGVKTIISVDGAKPDVKSAESRGMRYIHIPIGYHGLSAEQQLRIARAVRDFEGPIYLHCHHGKHRGPAAAATAAVLLGELTPEEGVALLKKAGTAPSYLGLYECVAASAPVSSKELDAVSSDFPSVAPVPDFIQAMADSQVAFDQLAAVRDAGWKVPADHPDLVPPEVAGRLENLMRAMLEDPCVKDHPADFAYLLEASWKAAKEFEDKLAAGAAPEELTTSLAFVNSSCKDCHVKYRDNR